MSATIEKIEMIVNEHMKNNQIPGAAIAVIRDREVVLAKGFGRNAAEEWGMPIRTNTLFRIASVSKLFTGTVMMMLVEKGQLDLDKTVQHYVPWFTTSDPELSKKITIRMLLSHSSGLPTGDDTRFKYDETAPLLYMKEVVPTLPILFEPGTAYSYGNHALNIAGFVAEQVTGTPFASLVQQLLFEPLNMNQTTYDPLKAMTYPLALPHEKAENGEISAAHQFYDVVASYPSYYAFSSVDDLCKFALMHLNDGLYENSTILSPASIKEMRSQQSKWYNTTDGGCGISFFKETKDGIDRYWHYGQYSSQYSSQFILVPEKGIAVIALANGENIFQAGYEIVDELLADVSSATGIHPSEPIKDSVDWDHFEGVYLHSYYGLMEIRSVSSEHALIYEDQKYLLQPFNSDTFLALDQEGQTAFNVGFPASTGHQSIKCVVVNSKACPEFKTDYIPAPGDWINWEGQFSDGRESYEVWIHGQNLMIKDVQNNMELTGRAIANNQFLTKEYGLVSFVEINGQINLEFDFAWRYPKQGVPVPSL